MWLEKIGLLANLLGTVSLAFAFGKQKNDIAMNTDESGKYLHFSYFKHPNLFWLGLGLLFIGFFLQLI